uniref:Uncharacterized protein n=1 Tax=Trichuris muris TaxID=70415 RepID=A0A5S6QV42_TRIMR
MDARARARRHQRNSPLTLPDVGARCLYCSTSADGGNNAAEGNLGGEDRSATRNFYSRLAASFNEIGFRLNRIRRHLSLETTQAAGRPAHLYVHGQIQGSVSLFKGQQPPSWGSDQSSPRVEEARRTPAPRRQTRRAEGGRKIALTVQPR